ncbi:MAG: SDR family oxidoreductase [Acidobacteriaceae bacterium]|nr:SDR family oxidoreductase [Acidobacteriaceae bacterium]
MPFAVITGASTGIGRELADLAARDGYDLVLVARSDSVLQAVAADLRQKWKRNVTVIAKDLAHPAAASEVFRALSDAALEVEVLVNNAGFGLLGKFWELDEREQIDMVQLNVTALTHLTRLFLPQLIARRRGMIMNVASTAAFQPGPLMSVYYATKAYVVSFSEAIHNEARDYGVTVTCVCPGPTKTEFDKRAGTGNTKLFASGNVMTARQVAEIGWKAMKRGKPLVVTGALNALTAFLTRFAPIQFTASMARKMQET